VRPWKVGASTRVGQSWSKERTRNAGGCAPEGGGNLRTVCGGGVKKENRDTEKKVGRGRGGALTVWRSGGILKDHSVVRWRSESA